MSSSSTHSRRLQVVFVSFLHLIHAKVVTLEPIDDVLVALLARQLMLSVLLLLLLIPQLILLFKQNSFKFSCIILIINPTSLINNASESNNPCRWILFPIWNSKPIVFLFFSFLFFALFKRLLRQE